MNDFIFLNTLIFLYKKLEPGNKNELLNKIEEYIEWLNTSKERFQFNYADGSLIDDKLIIFKELQSLILLDKFEDTESYLIKMIDHYIYNVTKEGMVSSFYR